MWGAEGKPPAHFLQVSSLCSRTLGGIKRIIQCSCTDNVQSGCFQKIKQNKSKINLSAFSYPCRQFSAPFLASWSSFPLQLTMVLWLELGHFILYNYPAVLRSVSIPKLLLPGNSSDSNRLSSENFDLISLFERAVHISLPGNFGDCSFPFGRGKLASQSLQERSAVCQRRSHAPCHQALY